MYDLLVIIFGVAVLRRLTHRTGIILLATVCLDATLHGDADAGWDHERPQPEPVRYTTTQVLAASTASGPAREFLRFPNLPPQAHWPWQ